MLRHPTVTLSLLAALFVNTPSVAVSAQESTRPRVIVLTDITNEPDDQESLVRFLVYSNEYDVEGLIATTSTWLRNRTSEQNIRDCVAAYGKVRSNLLQHADGFPTSESLSSMIKEGYPEFGMNGVGQGKSSAGSRHIIDVVDRADPRPVWISVWGGANCLAQALWEVRRDRNPPEVDRFVSKLRVYTISDQDDAGPWMRRNFPGLFYIVSPSGERADEYHRATWTGISGDEFYLNGPGHRLDLVSNAWLRDNVRTGHGPLGEMYPAWEYIMEGDTPSFLNLINNGLGSHLSPGYGGWGGRYAFKQSYADLGPIWTDSRDSVTTPDGRTFVSNQATIWRWRAAFQHDFAARMDWCVANSPEQANHNPIVVIEGDRTKDVLHKNVRRGQRVPLSAMGSRDPDGDGLTYRWFHYPEAGRDLPNARTLWSTHLEGRETPQAMVAIPQDLPRGAEEIHIILDVSDDGEPPLHAYRRMILHVRDRTSSSRAESEQQTRQLRWRKHTINDRSPFEAAGAADFNRDGLLDVFSGDSWYEAPDWKRHQVRDVPVGTNPHYHEDFADLPLDVDGDGDLDIVTCAYFSRRIGWVEHPGDPTQPWIEHLIDTPGSMETGLLVDLNSDGMPDFLPNVGGIVTWYALTAREPEVIWKRNDLAHIGAGHGVGTGDVNGDGRTDIITPKGWYEQPPGANSLDWVFHAEFELGAASIPIIGHDFDGDGDTDLIWGMGHDFGLHGLKQSTGANGARVWTREDVDTSFSQVHALHLADFNGDARPEIVTGKRVYAHVGEPGATDAPCLYHFDYDRESSRWIKQVIYEGNPAENAPQQVENRSALVDFDRGSAGTGLQLDARDMDGDGDIDLICPGKSGLYWFENLRLETTATQTP